MRNISINDSTNQPESKEDGKSSFKERFSRALKFAQKLATGIIYDTAKSSSKKSSSYSSYTKEQVLGYLRSPTQNANNLRNVSCALYVSSPRYRQLIDHRAGIWLYDYAIVPVGIDKDNLDLPTFKKQYLEIETEVEKWNLKHEIRKAAVTACKEGIFFGVSWDTADSFFIQKLDASMCSVYAISDGTPLFTVDMSKINKDELSMYPPAFTKMYAKYESDKQKYQPVPPEIAWCLAADESDMNAFIPPYAGIIPELLDIETYRNLQQSVDSLANYKVLVARSSLGDDGLPDVDDRLAEKYYEQLCKAVPDQVGVAVLPFKVEEFDFPQSNEVASVDIVSRSTDQFWESCGTSSALHGAKITTAGSLKLVTQTEANIMYGLLLSAERMVNRHLKYMNGKYKFRVRFLPTTRYNQSDVVGMFKESATYGVAPSMYFSAVGLQPGETVGMSVVEDEIIKASELKPLKNTHTMSSEDTDAGRPQLDNEDLTEEGERSREK